MTAELAQIGTFPASVVSSPFDDPLAWRDHPILDPPASAEQIAEWQHAVNDIIGTTQNGEPQCLIVWNGDHRYWQQFYTDWNSYGEPTSEIFHRPIVRYKTFSDDNGTPYHDVFPPRWLLLARLEPEQYPNYREECWVSDPTLGDPVFNVYSGAFEYRRKKIRPDTPPPVDWMWFQTIAVHTPWCCEQKRNENKKCFGSYAPPPAAFDDLRDLVKSMEREGFKGHSPYKEVTGDSIDMIRYNQNRYDREITNLRSSAQIAIENPIGFMGGRLALEHNIDTPQKAREAVEQYFESKIEAVNEKFAK